MEEIKITDFENIQIGCAQDPEGGTGCTVVLCGRNGAAAALDVRGGGPASRESQLLDPSASVQRVHAVLLSGGSAFGLDAAAGVMQYLAARNIGVDTGFAPIPIVCASCLYDLGVGSPAAKPDKEMGFTACLDAEKNQPREGNFGAGTGASVGKLWGMQTAMKSGQGFYAVRIGELKVGAIVAVNALGDVFDPDTGEKIAGLLQPDSDLLADSEEALFADYSCKENFFTGNTTLGILLTNGRFDKAQLKKAASMAHNGYARSIRPVHTAADGDTIYALSAGEVKADIDVVGTLGARVMARAVARAVRAARPAYGMRARSV